MGHEGVYGVEWLMRWIVAGVMIGLLALAPAAQAAGNTPAAGTAAHKIATQKKAAQKSATHKKLKHKKQRVSRHWHGYGFLPGYRPPEVIEREREEHYWASGPHWYGPAWPRFYRGRWNGGGFGPCYTETPIGYMWNCGK